MDDNNQTPQQPSAGLAEQYQSILDKYAQELAVTPPEPPAPPEIPPTPPELPPEPVMVPPVPPVPPIPPQLTPEPVTPPLEPITPPPPVNPEVPVVSQSKPNNFFKILFILSLLVFLGVLGANIYAYFFAKPTVKTAVTPTLSPVPTTIVVNYCELNNQRYSVDQTFPAQDGCNTCTCQSDLTITCTNNICPTAGPTKKPTATPKISATPTLKPSPTSISENINTSFSCGIYSGTNYPPRPSFGSNPLLVSLSPSGSTANNISLAGFQWDYLGNGSWDSSISNGLTAFTYTQNGTFTPKFRVKGSDGSVGPTCTYPYSVIVGASTEFSNSIITVDKLNLNITISKASHNYNFSGIDSNLNNGGSRIFAPGFSVSAKDQFTATRSKTPYNNLFGVYETGFDMDKGTSGNYHLFIDKNQPNGSYTGEYQLTYTTANGTVTNNGPDIKFNITLTD